MPHTSVLAIAGSTKVIAQDFTRGDRVIHAPRLRRETEDDAWAHTLWLDNHKRSEEANEFLEEYCRRH